MQASVGRFHFRNQVLNAPVICIHCSPTYGEGAQWLSGRVLDSRLKGRGFEPHRRHCVVSLSKNINPSLVLVQPRKTRPFITERLLMGRKETNQTKPPTGMDGDNDFHFSEPCNKPALWGQADGNNPALCPTLHNR